ncbi:MAG: PAS domain-containing protein [Desulfobacteraceae bacterium]|nr:PAS domain-containing protein [Desulfobacteraceae bacterium]
MNNNRKRKLFWQIYPSYLIVILICTAMGSYYASTSIKSFFYSQVETTLYEKSELFIPVVEKEFLKNSSIDELDLLCEDAGKRAGLRFTIVDFNGKVLGDSDESPEKMENHKTRPEIRAAYSGKKESNIRYSDTLKQKMLYAALPIYIDNNVVGVLRSSVSLESIGKELFITNLKIAGAGFMIALLATFISFIFSLKITKPIVEMKNGAKDFSKGNLGTKLFVPDIKELGELAETLNLMAAELNERLKTESRNRNELETVFSSMTEGVLALDTSERIMRLNQSALDIFSMELSEIKNKNVYELVRDSELYKFIQDSVRTENHISSDLKYGKKREKILNAHSSPLKDEKNKRIGTLFVIQDVTRIRQLENMRRDFVANVSHELKTPMTAIKGFVETIRESGDIERERLDRFLSIIDKNVDRLINIINDLLDLSWIEKNEESEVIKFKEESLYELVDSAVKICEPSAINKNIEITASIDESMKISVNRVLFENAITNLIDNAVKYSDEGKKVKIMVKETSTDFVISVEDQGIGISSMEHQRIFERFYRVDKGRSRKMGGTGLGLAIVKHVMNIHKGSIELSSVPGKGSCFSLRVPKNL